MEYIIDLKNVKDKEEAHKIIKEALNFPDYYGANLDALNDALSELEEGSSIVIYVDEDMSEDLEKIISVFAGQDNISLILD